MKHTILKVLIVFMIFFAGTAGILFLDDLCLQTTGHGGNLVLNVEN
ncbi:MAG: hypothetical protein ACLU5E_03265 [Anaerovoracaceae bacterium]|uniref:Uncharacterized protein n=1 Tax=Candidatus Allocopromorpha excrementavium TaxID=2840741 RepID=A0A9D1HCJ3_9FIRM|nr:hypothetical protein [Candidatus Copromorpha excrementavium]